MPTTVGACNLLPVSDRREGESEFERTYRSSLEREHQRLDNDESDSKRLVWAYVGGGALGLGLIGLLLGPGGLWASPDLGERLELAGLFALGGGFLGLRLWMFRERD